MCILRGKPKLAKQFEFVTAAEPPRNVNPCLLGTCGPNSECHELDGRAVCSCAFGMLGAPPNCRPECVIHQECPSNRACIAQQCQDPCIGSCGFNARCTTQNHQPICSCIEGYEGDPYASCTPRQGEYIFVLSRDLWPNKKKTYRKHFFILDFTSFHCIFAPFSSFIEMNTERKYAVNSIHY